MSLRAASSPVSEADFPEGSVLVNLCGPAETLGPLAVLRPGSCHLPPVPVRDLSKLLPPSLASRAVPFAWISALGGEKEFPAAVELPGRRVVCNIDIRSLVDLIRREGYFRKPRPLYTYLPFNVQRIPPSWRQIASGFLKGGKGPESKALFPRFPKDDSVETLTGLLAQCVERASGKASPPAPLWPAGKRYAFILTHDVDSPWIYRDGNLKRFMDAEARAGIPGAWYFVANLYEHDHAQIGRLASAGHEIGLHGDNHDHKISFLSEASMRRRLDGCRSFIERHGVTGYRAPHYLRSPELYRVLRDYVRYDTSMHDSYNPTSKIELMREGCSTVLPFALSDEREPLVELPITVPEDYEVFDPARGAASIVEAQLAQIEEVKKRGGLATLVIHPEPHFTGRGPCFEAMEAVLRAVSADPEAWIALPRDVHQRWISSFTP